MALIRRASLHGRRAAPYFASSVKLVGQSFAFTGGLDTWHTTDGSFEIRAEFNSDEDDRNMEWRVAPLVPFEGTLVGGDNLAHGLVPVITEDGAHSVLDDAIERALAAALAWLNRDVPPDILEAARKRHKLARVEW